MPYAILIEIIWKVQNNPQYYFHNSSPFRKYRYGKGKIFLFEMKWYKTTVFKFLSAAATYFFISIQDALWKYYSTGKNDVPRVIQMYTNILLFWQLLLILFDNLLQKYLFMLVLTMAWDVRVVHLCTKTLQF